MLDHVVRKDDLDKTLNVGILIVCIELKEEESLHIFEFGLLLDKVFEKLLILLTCDLKEIKELQDWVDMLLGAILENAVEEAADLSRELVSSLIESERIVY